MTTERPAPTRTCAEFTEYAKTVSPRLHLDDGVQDMSTPRPLLAIVEWAETQSSDDEPQVRIVLEDMQAEIQQRASESIRRLSDLAAAHLRTSLQHRVQLRDDQVEGLQRVRVFVEKVSKRSASRGSSEPTEPEGSKDSARLAWTPIAESGVSALLDCLVSGGGSKRWDTNLWTEKTLESINPDRFSRVTGLPGADIPTVIGTCAESVVKASEDSADEGLPQYFKDRWGSLRVEDGDVLYRPTVPGIVVRGRGVNQQPSTLSELCDTSEQVEVLPLCPSMTRSDGPRRTCDLDLAPDLRSSIDFDTTGGSNDCGALSRMVVTCENIEPESASDMRWTATRAGLLGEWYVSEDPPISMVRYPGIESTADGETVTPAINVV